MRDGMNDSELSSLPFEASGKLPETYVPPSDAELQQLTQTAQILWEQAKDHGGPRLQNFVPHFDGDYNTASYAWRSSPTQTEFVRMVPYNNGWVVARETYDAHTDTRDIKQYPLVSGLNGHHLERMGDAVSDEPIPPIDVDICKSFTTIFGEIIAAGTPKTTWVAKFVSRLVLGKTA